MESLRLILLFCLPGCLVVSDLAPPGVGLLHVLVVADILAHVSEAGVHLGDTGVTLGHPGQGTLAENSGICCSTLTALEHRSYQLTVIYLGG